MVTVNTWTFYKMNVHDSISLKLYTSFLELFFSVGMDMFGKTQ